MSCIRQHEGCGEKCFSWNVPWLTSRSKEGAQGAQGAAHHRLFSSLLSSSSPLLHHLCPVLSCPVLPSQIPASPRTRTCAHNDTITTILGFCDRSTLITAILGRSNDCFQRIWATFPATYARRRGGTHRVQVQSPAKPAPHYHVHSEPPSSSVRSWLPSPC